MILRLIVFFVAFGITLIAFFTTEHKDVARITSMIFWVLALAEFAALLERKAKR